MSFIEFNLFLVLIIILLILVPNLKNVGAVRECESWDLEGLMNLGSGPGAGC